MSGAPLPSVCDVMTDVVCPAVAEVLATDEPDGLHLVRHRIGEGIEFALELEVSGELFEGVVYSSFADYSDESPREVLRSQLEDFVAESRFGWGQDRSGG